MAWPKTAWLPGCCVLLLAVMDAGCTTCPEGQQQSNGGCVTPCNNNDDCPRSMHCAEGGCANGPPAGTNTSSSSGVASGTGSSAAGTSSTSTVGPGSSNASGSAGSSSATASSGVATSRPPSSQGNTSSVGSSSASAGASSQAGNSSSLVVSSSTANTTSASLVSSSAFTSSSAGSQSSSTQCQPGATRNCGSNVGSCTYGTQACVGGVWETGCNGGVRPQANDTCDSGNDATCNGVPNEGCACINGATMACDTCGHSVTCTNGAFPNCTVVTNPILHCADTDADTWTTAECVTACPGQQPMGYVAGQSATVDCNDANAAVYPNAQEDCAGLDRNCVNGPSDGFACEAPQTLGCNVCDSTGARDCVGCNWEPVCRGIQSAWVYDARNPVFGHDCGGSGANGWWVSGGTPACFLQWGPYVHYPPGLYRARFETVVDINSGACGTLVHQAFFPETVFVAAQANLAPIPGVFDYTTEFEFTIPDCRQLELRVYFNTGCNTEHIRTTLTRIDGVTAYSL